MPVINTNVAANSAIRFLNNNAADSAESVSKLSSGSRIVRASDDAAGLAISTALQADLTTLRQAGVNASQGASILQIADGGLARIADVLQRLKALSVQANSGAVTNSERIYINSEYLELDKEIRAIVLTTLFNGKKLINENVGDFAVSTEPEDEGGTITADLTNGFDTKAFTIAEIALKDAEDKLDIAEGSLAAVDAAMVIVKDALTAANDDMTAASLAVGDASKEVTLASGLVTAASTAVATASAAYTKAAAASSVTTTLLSDYNNAMTTYTTEKTTYDGATKAYANATKAYDSATKAYDAAWTDFTTAQGTYNTDYTAAESAVTAAKDAFETAQEDYFDVDILVSETNCNVTTAADALEASKVIDHQLDNVSNQRSTVGALISRFDTRAQNIYTMIENTAAANSTIMDVDIAAEQTALIASNVRVQAAVSALSQANQLPQQLLRILQ